MPQTINHFEMTCLDLLPPSLFNDFQDRKSILLTLQILDFILDGVIQSQTCFYQADGLHFFDPHADQACCEIRAINLLLRKTHSFKSPLEFQYQIDYFHRMKVQVNEKLTYFSQHKNEKQPQNLMDFLKNNELIILIGVIDKYIFMSYVLATFEKRSWGYLHKLDVHKIAAHAKIAKKQAKKLAYYYQEMIPILSKNVILDLSEKISDRKKSEESLQLAKKQAVAANRAKIEFLENMRHDIRTPLTGIIGFAQLIQTESTNPRIKNYADNLVLATSALLDFQNEILEAIKVTTSTDAPTEETFHLKNLIEKVLNLVRPKAIIKHLELSLQVDEALPSFVRGDAKRLFRIVLELVTNALKFTAKGHIHVQLTLAKTNQDQLMLRCAVSDTGIGIPKDKMDDLFMRFHRLSPSSDGVYEGTGLGLTIVKKYIKDLSGKISVESNENSGTTFTFLIPLLIATDNKKDITSLPEPSENDTSFQHIQLLLVEDHLMTATVTQLMLQELGCSVDIAADAKTAILKSQEKMYDLILMDLGLPDCDGFGLAQQIRMLKCNTKNTPTIIALTAHKEEDSENRCIASGIDAIYQKPLLKSSAIKIFNTYCSGGTMQKKIIDLSLGAQRLNRDETTAKSMIDMLLKHIDDDCHHIKKAYQKNDWEKLRDENHKLLGGLAYCGVPRLESACQDLQKALKNPDNQYIHQCVQTLLSEIQLLKSAAQ